MSVALEARDPGIIQSPDPDSGGQPNPISPEKVPPDAAPADPCEPSPSPQNGEPIPYTVFTKWQRRWINLAAAFAGMFSTLCSYIYFPALDTVTADLSVSVSLVSLTVTSYLILAGVAPAVMGDLADRGGRRPVYGLMFLLLIGANVGIAVQREFAALLVLRTVQSAGSSGLIAAVYGVIADITTPGDRGAFVGFQILLQVPVSLANSVPESTSLDIAGIGGTEIASVERRQESSEPVLA